MKKLIFLVLTLSFSQIYVAFAQDDIATLAKVYGKLPEISSVDISPDGSKILMLQNYQGRKILVTKTLGRADTEQYGIPPVGDQEYVWARWASNDRVIASLRFPGIEKFIGLATFRTQGTRLIAMDWTGDNAINPIKKNPNRSRQTQRQDRLVDIMLDDPDHILLQLDWDERGEYGVYRIDITRPRNPVFVSRESQYVATWRADENHNVRYGDGYNERWGSNNTRYVAYHRKSLEDRWETLVDIDRRDELPPFMFQGFSKDPSIIYVTALDETGYKAAFEYNVDTRQIGTKIASVEGYDIEGVYVNEYDVPEYYIWYDKQPRIAFFDPEDQALLELLKNTFPGTSINFYGDTPDKSIITFETTSPTEPGTFYIFDRNERKMEMLGYNYADVDIEKLAEMTPVTYEARDGLEIPGYLSLPKGPETKNLPTVIIPHDGPGRRDNWQFDYWVQFLTAQGYAVLQMNYRGSIGYGDEFEESGNHQWGAKILYDINDGAKWMIDQGYSDPDRLCIAGVGYGGYAALQATIVDKTLYQCSIALGPYTNMERMRHEYYGYLIDYFQSDEYKTDDISPFHNVDNFSVPVLMAHGVNDRWVDINHGKFFASKMKSAGKNFKYIEWEDGDHFLSKEVHRVQFLEEMGRFLKQHL